MKKKLFGSALLCGLALFLINTGCNTPSKEGEKKETIIRADTIHAPEDSVKAQAYVCPMGPQCGQADKAGKCASCGMEMKENPAYKKN